MELKTITVGELRHDLTELLAMPDDTLVTFGQGDLSFSRTKNRGPSTGTQVVNFEFGELYRITYDPSTEPPEEA